MDCGVCSISKEDGDLQCPSCARAALYPVRVQHIQALLDRERAGKLVDDAVSATSHASKKPKSSPIKDGIDTNLNKLRQQQMFEEKTSTSLRIDRVTNQAALLRQEMDVYRKEIQERRSALDRRRADLTRARSNLQVQRKESIDSLKHTIKRTTRRHEVVYADTVKARIYICRGASNLARLHRMPKAGKGVKGYEYIIGGLELLDLRHLNDAAPEQLTTSLTNTARLLALCCRYLHVRLPAEITLPHPDYPLPTIFSPTSSYTGRHVPFPGSLSHSGSPKASRELETRTSGRPRPLFIDRPLARLAREDAQAYALFVEGVALLAWDVAWLSRTQGIAVASTEWEDVCDIGHNMWLIFVAAARRPAYLLRRQSSSTKKNDRQDQATGLADANHALGVFSHGSSINFLRGGSNPEAGTLDVSSRGWRYASPVKILHELKAVLSNEISGHDWELLDEQFFDMEQAARIEEEAVMINDKRQHQLQKVDSHTGAGRSPQDVKQKTTIDQESPPDNRFKSANAWTKLRSRAAS